MALITIDRVLAAQLLRDLAARVESSEVEITGIDNTVYEPLHKGFFKVEWRESAKENK